MLYTSLVLSGIHLAILSALSWNGPTKWSACLAAWLGLMCSTLCVLGNDFLPTFALGALLVAATATACATTGVSGRKFIAAAVVVTLAAYAAQSWRYWSYLNDISLKHPYVSLAGRRPSGRVTDATTPEDSPLLRRIETIDSDTGWGGRSRSMTLRAVHESKVNVFVNAPGFGVTRMSPRIWRMEVDRERPPVPQPEPPTLRPSPPDGDGWAEFTLARGSAGLGEMHAEGITQFANAGDFGYVRDREHVAGFRPHAISELPKPDEWRVAAIDLVSLLKHPEPAAYVSDHLPRMDELRDALTRPLDGFEAAALARIKKGEDVVTATVPGGLRMLGAIRAGRQCLACHDGDRGDLLGAFSYRLRPAR